MTCQHTNFATSNSCAVHEKKLFICKSPYFNFICHVKCAGLVIKKQKDFDTLYFICSRCEEFLKFSSTFITNKNHRWRMQLLKG